MLIKLAPLPLLLTASWAAIPPQTGYTLTWYDDFEGPQGQGVDTSKWNEAGPEDGKQNGEWQRYNNWDTANTHLSGDGQLYIIPKKNSTMYTSGRIESKSNFHCPLGSKMIVQSEFRVPDFTAGTSAGTTDGYWPAFWMLGASFRAEPRTEWPWCGERDIFEGSPFQGSNGVCAVHFHDGNGNNRSITGGITYTGDQYHTWALKVDRQPANTNDHSLIWYRDGTPFKTITKGSLDSASWTALAAKSYYIIMNLAIGARFGWPGVDEDDNFTNWPSDQTVTGYVNSMRIKYVAVYHSV
ncbi:glucan endo-1,3-beta-glucosidase A1 [Rhypophila decipiens]|uniref:Glucan endo-1,3-beta-glucosidase A1 n=1 Tax=Rhypophila decipiens TaxID=261697 RepID=A0AAN6XZ79_9PEZI|nr:glucan endo-1,3-beta-glucosidase A1 [Rhypophila decipiens]